jgi:transposase
MQEFWDDDCKEFSKDLWKPPINLGKSDKEVPYWNCDNENISFTYFESRKDIDINIDFKPIPIRNNDRDKRGMFFRMFAIEVKRLDKKLKKNKIKQSKLNDYVKNIGKIQKEMETIESAKKKHKKFFVRVNKKITLLKKQTKNFNKNNKLYPIVFQHFEQVDKIREKMKRLDDVVYCKKIKIVPTVEQEEIIMSWYWNTMEIYNDLVEEFNNIYQKMKDEYSRTNKEISFEKFLSDRLKTNNNFPISGKKLRDRKIHLLVEKYVDIPFCIIADTIMEFSSNLKGNLTKLRKGQIKKFSFNSKKFSRKNKILPIQQKYTSDKGFYPTILGDIEIDDNDFEWNNILSDYKLVYNRYHHTYYLHIPSYKQVHKINYERKPVGCMDPGMRAFQMLYGLDHVIAIGENLYGPIMEKVNKIEEMQKKLNLDRKIRDHKWIRHKDEKRLKKSSRKNYKRAMQRTDTKIKDMVTEMHNKLALFLCKTYDRIMVTDFSSRKVNGKKKGLHPNHKKVLGKLSHYNFRQRLEHKCQEYRCHYSEGTEEYTSKTCCRCGKINRNLGKKKRFKCNHCGLALKRDVNGAICIFIKNRHDVI